MAIVRAQIAIGADTAFPRDRVCITPHFKVTGIQPDWQNLADDLASGMEVFTGGSREVDVKVYDAEEAKPNPPKARKVLHTGLVPAASTNRETALCLSYYSGSNIPSKRGRIYFPAFLIGSSFSVRPTTAQMNLLRDNLVPLLSGLGGLNVDWCVWSRKNRTAHTVTNWYVDDEWDVQRRRGMRPTTRVTGTTSG